MRKLLGLTLVITTVLIFSFAYVDRAQAQGCVVTGGTPDGGEVVVCDGADNDGLTTTDQADEVTVEPGADLTRAGNDVIRTEDGNDFVEINGGMITGPPTDDENCIDLGSGVNELIMRDGTLRCGQGIRCLSGSTCKITIEGGTIEGISQVGTGDEAIQTDDGDDEIYIRGGFLTATDGVIEPINGNDTIIITGGYLKQLDDSNSAVQGNRGNDLISVSNATIDGLLATSENAINAGSEDDTVRLGTGAVILGDITGGPDFDTLVFEMGVTETVIPSLCSQLLAADPSEGEITINGLTYQWEQFEVILCELVPAEPRPIPTLSQWGMIVMAGLIGIAGILYYQRKRRLV